MTRDEAIKAIQDVAEYADILGTVEGDVRLFVDAVYDGIFEAGRRSVFADLEIEVNKMRQRGFN